MTTQKRLDLFKKRLKKELCDHSANCLFEWNPELPDGLGGDQLKETVGDSEDEIVEFVMDELEVMLGGKDE